MRTCRTRIVITCWLAMIAVWGGGAFIILHPVAAAQGIDDEVLRWASTIRTAGLDHFFRAATWGGSLTFLIPLTALAAALLTLRHRKREALFLFSALLGAAFLAGVVKLAVARPRPHLFPTGFTIPTTPSFPSNHSAQIVAFVEASWYVMRRLEKRLPSALPVVGVAIAALICFSRLYLQAHYLTDVIASVFATTLWVFGLALCLFPEGIKAAHTTTTPPMRNKFLGVGEHGYSIRRKFVTILSGLRYAVVYDLSVAYKLVASLAVLAAAVILHKYVDVLLLLLATGLVLITEIVNSAIEALCDFVEERHNEKIKVIKDIAAAAVGISIFVWLAVFMVEVVEMWQLLFAR